MTTDPPVALLPFDPALLGDGLPTGLDVRSFDGTGDPPDGGRVTFWMPAPRALRRLSELFAKMPALRVLQLQSAGVDHVLPDVPAGIAVCNARGVHDIATAELGIGLILASLRSIPDLVRTQDLGHWQRPTAGRTLHGARVLIVGYGSIGPVIAARLEPFGCEIVPVASARRAGVHGADELPTLLPSADIVVLLTPLTPQTRGMAGRAFLAAMPDGALLVNLARGPLVDTDALLAELTSGRLRAALDVTDPEPLPDGHPLWSAPGALISAHTGGRTVDAGRRVRVFVGAQLERFANDAPLENVVPRPA